ncbi:MAG TPA: glycosyl hydrolase, partial [Verrucomicrobiae bacterium]
MRTTAGACCLAAFLVFTGDVAKAESHGTAAVPASDFLDSIGVNSAIAARGENFQKTMECTGYLGVRWFRAGVEGNVPVSQFIELHRQTGARFSWGLGSGGSDISKLIETAKPLAEAGALLAFEGPNEPNNWGITYQGEAGGKNKSWVPVAKLQAALYQGV